jgi:hypothetical protein
MCKGYSEAVTCFRKEHCYRFTAKPNPFRQSYFVGIPVNVQYNEAGEQTQQCDELWLNNKLFGGI